MKALFYVIATSIELKLFKFSTISMSMSATKNIYFENINEFILKMNLYFFDSCELKNSYVKFIKEI